LIRHIFRKFKREGFKSFLLSIIKYPLEFKRRRTYQNMLAKKNITDRFTEIYTENLWSSAESASGDGSEIISTESLRGWMIDNFPKLKIKNFVDASCGDFNWMKLVLQKLELNYIGLDIVKELIHKNTKLYNSESIRFQVCNICEDTIPPSDLIMVRDCLFHLSFMDIDKFLKNLYLTDYKYLLTTTHLVDKSFRNTDITSGDFRIIDLFSRPFNFNESLVQNRVKDCPIGSSVKKEIILIEKKDVPTTLQIIK